MTEFCHSELVSESDFDKREYFKIFIILNFFLFFSNMEIVFCNGNIKKIEDFLKGLEDFEKNI